MSNQEAIKARKILRVLGKPHVTTAKPLGYQVKVLGAEIRGGVVAKMCICTGSSQDQAYINLLHKIIDLPSGYYVLTATGQGFRYVNGEMRSYKPKK
jgi:hypothetical protein